MGTAGGALSHAPNPRKNNVTATAADTTKRGTKPATGQARKHVGKFLPYSITFQRNSIIAAFEIARPSLKHAVPDGEQHVAEPRLGFEMEEMVHAPESPRGQGQVTGLPLLLSAATL